MELVLDREALDALDLAKRSVREDEDLEARHLLSALYYGTRLRERLPQLAAKIPVPELATAEPGRRRVSPRLREVLARFTDIAAPATPAEVFAAIVSSPAGRDALVGLGVSDDDTGELAGSLPGPAGAVLPRDLGWRQSQERVQVVEALSTYGRTLTAVDLPPHDLHGMETVLRRIMQGLIQRKQHSVVLVGPPGVGKSAIVLELARRVSAGDPLIAAQLRDVDVFELSPAFLTAGASVVGQFEERVKALLEILTAHPKVIVFVDEVHSLLQSEMHVQTPWSGASAEFKKAVGSGTLSLIGCTTLAEYRHYIEPDRALADRFTQVRIDPPTGQQTVEIMRARLPSLRAYYRGLRIPDRIVPVTVELAEDHLLGRYQPRKSIRLLDQACAWCLVQDPPLAEVTKDALHLALESETGQRIIEPRALTEEGLYRALSGTIVGQDALLRELAAAVVTGLGTWRDASKGPRGNFFFAGPTGAGKTETAKALAEAIGGTSRALVRIDCNTLQGSGWDSREAISALLGPPPGFIGYVRGEGGLLSRVRNTPDCVVLFDEIEKADPGVGKLLLQVLDEGLVDDNDGNPLDFRRAFLVFTSNAGVTYRGGGAGHSPGFGLPGVGQPRSGQASVSAKTVMDDLRQHGFPQEFLGRNFQWFVFQSLTEKDVPEVLRRQLEGLRAAAAGRHPPVDVRWDPAVVDRIAGVWDPQFGVRHLITLLRNRVIGQLSIAEAHGELNGVTCIELTVPAASDLRPGAAHPGGASHRREEDTLVIELELARKGAA
jgi:ATP-dependent Clp protease ATP-binding subunit ClpA